MEEQIPFNFNKPKEISDIDDGNPKPVDEARPASQTLPEEKEDDLDDILKRIDEELFTDLDKADPDLALTIQELISNKNKFKKGDLQEDFVALVKIKYNNTKNIDFANNNWDEYIFIIKMAKELKRQGRKLDPKVLKLAIIRIKEWKRNISHYTNK